MFSISKLVFAGIAALTAVNATPLIQERQAGLVVTPGPTVECTESKISWSGFADGPKSIVIFFTETDYNYTSFEGVTGDSYTWTPKIAGDTTVSITVKDSAGKSASADVKVQKSPAGNNKCLADTGSTGSASGSGSATDSGSASQTSADPNAPVATGADNSQSAGGDSTSAGAETTQAGGESTQGGAEKTQTSSDTASVSGTQLGPGLLSTSGSDSKGSSTAAKSTAPAASTTAAKSGAGAIKPIGALAAAAALLAAVL